MLAFQAANGHDQGKLAPTLIEDLHLYDPRHPLANGLNVLRDSPLFYSGYSDVGSLLPEHSCRHAWCTKDKQAGLPALDARPGPDTVYKFEGVCRECRTHLELEVNYTVRWEAEPCPNSTRPLHHLVHSLWREGVAARNDVVLGNAETDIETLAFECSSPTCSAAAFVRLRPPVLSDEHIRLLTDESLLNSRAEEVMGLEPSRFEGHKKPTHVDVLTDLRKYLKDSFENQETKPIKIDNKRFSLRFGMDGQACKDVLKFLGFEYQHQEHWLPPRPNHHDQAPYKDPRNVFLDNVVWEITILISLLSKDDRRQVHDITNLPDADKDLFRVLGAQDYDKHTSARTTVPDPARRNICYAALGAPQDASDEIVSFAYREQIRTNASERPMYLTYLRQIATERRSELLQTIVATEYSAGNFDSEQLNEAYRYFSLSPRDEGLTDDLILGTFKARFENAVVHGADMRAHLKTIGTHRRSQRIKDVADDGKLHLDPSFRESQLILRQH